MTEIYFLIVGFLLLLAVFDLFVGVSNDAVNFLNSAIGAKVARFKTVMAVASVGVLIGALMSSGMMDVARHGIMQPSHYSFEEAMVIFLAVMVTDVVILDVFNSLGMPTSTTVSLVFELLGATFVTACIKLTSPQPSPQGEGALMSPSTLGELINTDKALSVIIAIFVSVAIAFVSGVVVQWVVRLMFTFNLSPAPCPPSQSQIAPLTAARNAKGHSSFGSCSPSGEGEEKLPSTDVESIGQINGKSYKKGSLPLWGGLGRGVFGGLCFTALGYFILIKGLGKSPFISNEVRTWIDMNTSMLLLGIFLGTAVLSYILNALKINVLRIIVLTGTFALAMAFAGNDLVNFIGVPLAALDSLIDFLANGNGDASAFMMTSLEESAKSPLVYLLLAGVIMIVAMVTSKKAQNVVKTSVDLSRQDEGEEMFGSSRVARSIVRFFQGFGEVASAYIPRKMRTWVDSRFDKEEAVLAEGAAFDEVRAAVNLVLAALLIIMGTTFKLPLSTTYVTFMVAMGASLADRAWSRESAVFRITGVLSVIGGWFITAGVAFAAAATVCVIMYYGGFIAMFAFMALAVYLLWRSNVGYKEKTEAAEIASAHAMLRSKDRFEVWNMLREHFSDFQATVLSHMTADYKLLVKAMADNDLRTLRSVRKRIKEATVAYKRNRRMELLALRRAPMDTGIERNTWFHLAQNADSQYIYCLTRILDPVIEHVDNGFEPIPQSYMAEYSQVLQRTEVLLTSSHTMMQSRNFKDYYNIMEIADSLKDELSGLRKMHIDRMQSAQNINLTTSQLYLNLLQETQELLSIMRHQLRATKNFTA